MKEKGKLIGSPQQAPLGYCDYSAIHKETPHYREDVCVNHTADPVAIPFSDAPCSHSSQYCYTSDGGKNIICLLCEHLEAESPRQPSADSTHELSTDSYLKVNLEYLLEVVDYPDSANFTLAAGHVMAALTEVSQHPVPAPEIEVIGKALRQLEKANICKSKAAILICMRNALSILGTAWLEHLKGEHPEPAKD